MKPKLESAYIAVENIVKIEHIGGTAVPRLILKHINVIY